MVFDENNQRLGPCGCALVDGSLVCCATHQPEWSAAIQRFADRIDAKIAADIYADLVKREDK